MSNPKREDPSTSAVRVGFVVAVIIAIADAIWSPPLPRLWRSGSVIVLAAIVMVLVGQGARVLRAVKRHLVRGSASTGVLTGHRPPLPAATVSPEQSAKRWGLIASLLSIIVIGPAWFAAGLALYFTAGGSVYGGPNPPELHTLRFEAAELAIWLVAAGCVAGVGHGVYHLRSRRNR